ncbi:MAG TPA: glycosyltransferase family 2 protein [Terracidiphilus sp.]|jgi:glycosyltransferase involved in cell wall biosynthesis
MSETWSVNLRVVFQDLVTGRGPDGGCIKFSIVTNAFNQGKYLATAMSSVLAQNWPEIEYLVVDPGSTDQTSAIIRTFQQRYPGRIVHITERDQGPAEGLNKAFARATGEVFGYLNADDFYLPGCFRAAAQAVGKFPQAAAIYADGYKANAEGKAMRRVVSTTFTAKRFVYGGALVLQQSTFYRAEAFRKVGGFNIQNRTSWDIEILLDMSLKSMQLVHIPGYWSVFRVHAESITGSQRLADESKMTQARYFKTVLGREKTSRDRALSKLVLGYTLLTEPRGLVVRVADRIWNSGFTLRPAQLEEGKNPAF